jgi:hypothetical protein
MPEEPILKVATTPDFGNYQIVRKLIHRMGEAFAISSGGFESRLRGPSGFITSVTLTEHQRNRRGAADSDGPCRRWT